MLLVAGTERQLERLKQRTLSDTRQFGMGQTVVVGYGEVGRMVTGELAEAGIPYTVLDLNEAQGVDVVGDATEPGVMERAGVDEATTVVLALSDDATTEFATLVARDLNADGEIIARAEETGNVKKIYRAGADYVLSLATVSGRLLASAILEDEDVLSMDQQVEVVRLVADGLAGSTLGEADVRDRTGCTVVAIERDGSVLTDLGPDVRVRTGDRLVVAGTDTGVTRFRELFG